MFAIKDVSVRNWQHGDEIYLLDFAEKQNWDIDKYEVRTLIKLDPESFLVAVDNLDTPIGFIAATLKAPSLRYISFFIVRNDLRNRGIGRKLWKSMLEKAGDTNMCLDTGPELKEWYMVNGLSIPTEKYYFYDIKLTDEMKTVRNTKLTMVPLSEESWPLLMEYDRHVYPNFDREKILRAWFTDEVVKVTIAMKDGIVRGYCCIIHRQTGNYYTLRNGFADDEDVLEEMLRNMLKDLSTGSRVQFVLQEGKALPKYLNSSNYLNLDIQRLYSKEIIDINTQRIWLGPVLII